MEELKQFLADLNRDELAAMTNKVLYMINDLLFRDRPPQEDIADLAEMGLTDCEDLLEVIKPEFIFDIDVLAEVIKLLNDIINESEEYEDGEDE